MATPEKQPPANWQFNNYFHANQLTSLSYATISATNGYINSAKIERDGETGILPKKVIALHEILKK